MSQPKQKVGKVLSLFIVPSGNTAAEERESLSVDSKGVLGDKHYNKVINRSVLLTTSESYGLLESLDIHADAGTLGENILIDYNPYHLPIGAQLKIGTAIVEITQNCTLCKHLSSIDKRVPKLLKDDRGIFVKVVVAGEIAIGDSVLI